MSRVGDDSGSPRAIVHKKILDVAESDPDASMEAIAAEVSGASIDLVERVLDEYGDPCAEPSDDTGAEANGNANGTGQPTDSPAATMSDPDRSQTQTQTPEEPNPTGTPVDRDELSDKQLATLRAIAANPDCSQAELAEEFDVTRATISRWVNDIPGFEWSRRGEFATRILGDGDGGTGGSGDRAARNGDGSEAAAAEPADADGDGDAHANEAGDGESAASGTGDGEPDDGPPGSGSRERDAPGVDELRDRLTDLERRLDGREADGTPTDDGATGAASPPPVEPELAHRVVHACMASDRISEDEELRLLELFMGAGD